MMNATLKLFYADVAALSSIKFDKIENKIFYIQTSMANFKDGTISFNWLFSNPDFTKSLMNRMKTELLKIESNYWRLFQLKQLIDICNSCQSIEKI